MGMLLVKILLENGAQVNLQSNKGWSALMISSQKGHVEVARSLLENGAQIDLQERSGWNAEMIAIKHNHADVVKLLQEQHIPMDLQNKGMCDYNASFHSK